MSQKNSHKTVEGIARIGIDLAKSVFHLAAMDSRGRLLLRKRFTRSGLLELLKLFKPCLAGMEACAGAHHLGGKMRDMGFDVRLMAPQHLKPCVKSNKNDRADAEAIRQAVGRPAMRFVPLKGPAQLEVGRSTGSGAWRSPGAWQRPARSAAFFWSPESPSRKEGAC